MFHTLTTLKLMADFTSDEAVANLGKLLSTGQSLTVLSVFQFIWYNAANMRKINIKVSKQMEERDEEDHLLGGVIGADLSKIVISNRETGK